MADRRGKYFLIGSGRVMPMADRGIRVTRAVGLQPALGNPRVYSCRSAVSGSLKKPKVIPA
jgi:hypothetical protein